MVATWCTTTPILRPSLGTRACHSAPVRALAKAASARAPSSSRTARASARWLSAADRVGVTAGFSDARLVIDLTFRKPPAPHCTGMCLRYGEDFCQSHAQASDLFSRPSASHADRLRRPIRMPAVRKPARQNCGERDRKRHGCCHARSASIPSNRISDGATIS
jgi:hypothetical protein